MIDRTNRLALMLPALLAALMWGASAPLSKVLLEDVGPLTLVGIFYLSAAAGVWAMRRSFPALGGGEARLARSDAPWLLATIVAGGIAAPVVLMYGLKHSPASTASLLLNFEAVATTIIAALAFRESVGPRVWLAVGVVTAGAILLSVDPSGGWGISLGALAVVASCALWGLDNNAARNVSHKDPSIIVLVKGSFGGGACLAMGLVLGEGIPGPAVLAAAAFIGFLSYGLSLMLFIHSLRGIGAARTSAVFSLAPFAAFGFSIIIFMDLPAMGTATGAAMAAAFALMAVGIYLLVSEHHGHGHTHEKMVHDHIHTHDDHHDHTHDGQKPSPGTRHSHVHTHEPATHDHPHAPDIHHRHAHP